MSLVVTKQVYKWFDLIVKPVPETLRGLPGGKVVDIRIEDERSTATYATVNVEHVIDRQGRPYSY